jgi:endonuclease YncB( thermonuclease family)
MMLRSFTSAPLLIVAACLCPSTAFADNLSGQASIIDGDTLEIHGTRIRLWGIDAPDDKSQSEADHAGRGIWAGSYVAPWLFRACIRQGGKPGDCSDDATMHP